MKAWSKPAVAAACLGYALIAAALFLASPWIRPVPSTGVFLAALSAAALWACMRLPVRIWLRGRALAGLLAVAGGGALAYVRLKKSGKNRKPAYDYALDDEEDEEQSE